MPSASWVLPEILRFRGTCYLWLTATAPSGSWDVILRIYTGSSSGEEWQMYSTGSAALPLCVTNLSILILSCHKRGISRGRRRGSFGRSLLLHFFPMAVQPLLGPGLFFSSVIIFTQTIGLLGWVISPSRGRYLYTGQQKHRINTYTDIHALSCIRTHDPSFRASENSSCLRQRGHRDRPFAAVELAMVLRCLYGIISVANL
jgi:hypothetical protein